MRRLTNQRGSLREAHLKGAEFSTVFFQPSDSLSLLHSELPSLVESRIATTLFLGIIYPPPRPILLRALSLPTGSVNQTTTTIPSLLPAPYIYNPSIILAIAHNGSNQTFRLA